jgi:hypothetical protein
MGLTDFKGIHAGETIWVLGSGTTLDHVPASFFDDKTCVCVNNVGRIKGLSHYYTVTHYHSDAVIEGAARPDLPVIAPASALVSTTREAACINETAKMGNVHRAPTAAQRFSAFNPVTDWPTDPDELVVGPTSLHMTMHFAQYLGAAHIVLVGADCGLLDGRANFTDYEAGDNPIPVWAHFLPLVADELRKRGTEVYSLNPFSWLGLDGHSFRSTGVVVN